MLRLIGEYPPACRPEPAKMLGEEPVIHPTCIVRNSRLGSWTELYRNCDLTDCTFGDYSYAAGDVSIIYADIGRFCSIASHVRINPVNHPMNRVTQHHCTYRRKQFGFDTADDEEIFNWRRQNKSVIENDVWIGHGAIIMPGVRIGTGAVIGSGAVVTKDVGPYEIAVGVPARVIKKRFSDGIIAKLLNTAWWDWDRPTLVERFKDLLDMERFIEKYCSPE